MNTHQRVSPILQKRLVCRACGATQLEEILRLGPTPLANSFLRCDSAFHDEPTYPLDVYFCQTCSLVQLLDVIDPNVLFGEYIYVSGTSETVAAHNAEYAHTVVQRLGLKTTDLVVEIASNDGSLLKCFKNHGARTLGVEPARNIAEAAVRDGIQTVNCFFNFQTSQPIARKYGQATVLIANNVLAHVDDTQDFLLGCRQLLGQNGLLIIEVPYLGKLLENLEYDTVYHEHLCYFSVTALLRLFEKTGFSVVDIDQVPIHGGSLRVFAGLQSESDTHAESVLAFADEERSLGITKLETYHRFAQDVTQCRDSLVELLRNLPPDNGALAAYGAPAKGNTLLNYCKIGTNLLPFTVDKNPLKVGCFTPGMHIPVLPVSAIAEKRPDYLLILAWNFAEEIMRQQVEFRARGGKFIIPIPFPKVV